ncbi:hypothetical protein LV47_03610 [Acinetobacter baumannii]|nr:hypothetical protein LV47_03610 [Acinetobacter baumannii]KZA53357.1 hypothetical protein LV49_03785 [Acinetobacter baumannii]
MINNKFKSKSYWLGVFVGIIAFIILIYLVIKLS